MPKGEDQPNASTENAFVADKLREVADLLEQQGAVSFRVRAYREATTFVASLPEPIRQIYEAEGQDGLERLPTIGSSISYAIASLLDSGTLGILDRLRGAVDPDQLFQTVPMIGPALARIIHETLHIETLEALEEAAVDGRLLAVKGIGQRRVDSIRHSLNDMLKRRRQTPTLRQKSGPAVSDILSIDREYREAIALLPTIKPRRFNETGTNRIPILHAERGPWRFTAMYSNTALAHQYHRTKDWVVIYYERDGQPEGQSTVVTAHHGALKGRRIVRGQEKACEDFYSMDGEVVAYG